ncbi:MAG: T9SS type A sorting domain-containing protein [Bacteroidales bacterium]|jgi:hypothetical protein|nr:T9SS type A sorting domain-containing protein [Bacteroidales bacterium]
MKKIYLVLLLLGTMMFSAQAQYITAEDDASNYETWANGNNEGFGFGAWDLWNTGTSGHFLQSSAGQGFGDINTDSKAFGMYGNPSGDNYANAQRLVNNWADGASFTIDLAIAYRNGFKGIDVFALGFENVFNFNANNDSYFTGGVEQSSWGYSQTSIFTITISQNGDDLNISVQRGSDTYSTTISSKTFYAFKLYVGSTEGGDLNNLYFNSLKVEYSDPSKIPAAANVKVNGNVNLAVDESLTVNDLTVDGSNSFTLKSDATGTGSLIVNGTATGNITAERYIAGADWTTGDDGWHFLSSPVASQAIQPNFVSNTPATTEDFYSWDEVNNEWMNAKDGDGNWNSGFDANFVVAKGYLVAYDNDATKEFIGTPNTGDQVTQALTAENGKYNLIGNPFSSAITWNDGNWTLGNVGGTAQIWNSNAKDYVSLLANNIVPAMNGFMVYTESSQTLTIPAASQTHSATAWYKNSNEDDIILAAHDPNNNSYKQAIVGERSDASEGFDLSYDAFVLEGFAPKFYSVNDNQHFTVNMFSEISDELTIPFGFQKNEGDEYYIQMEHAIPNRTILLTDLKTNITHNLSENPTYSFTSSSTDSPDRFLLHFGVVGIGEQDQATTLHAYAYNNRLYVNNSLEQAQIAVYDLQGRLLMQQSANASGLQSLPLDLPAGVYVVRLSNAQEAKSVKINVQ